MELKEKILKDPVDASYKLGACLFLLTHNVFLGGSAALLTLLTAGGVACFYDYKKNKGRPKANTENSPFAGVPKCFLK